jgi:hypothetical protein
MTKDVINGSDAVDLSRTTVWITASGDPLSNRERERERRRQREREREKDEEGGGEGYL